MGLTLRDYMMTRHITRMMLQIKSILMMQRAAIGGNLVYYLVAPLENVSLSISESLVQVNKLSNPMLAHVIGQFLRLFPAQGASFREQAHFSIYSNLGSLLKNSTPEKEIRREWSSVITVHQLRPVTTSRPRYHSLSVASIRNVLAVAWFLRFQYEISMIMREL